MINLDSEADADRARKRPLFKSALLVALLLAGRVAAGAAPTGASTPFTDLKPTAELKLGKTADWVLATGGTLWVGSTGPFAGPSACKRGARPAFSRRNLRQGIRV